MASEQILAGKKARVAEVAELLKNSCAGVIVDYKGITVEEDTKLRKELREAGVTYFVEKNSILRFALKEAGILGKYADASEGKFKVKAGYIGEDIYDEAGVMALSKIPSRDVLLAQLVGSLQGPIQKLAALLKAVSEKDGEAA